MSTKAKLTLAATSLGAIGIIVFVHHGQKVEKASRLPDCQRKISTPTITSSAAYTPIDPDLSAAAETTRFLAKPLDPIGLRESPQLETAIPADPCMLDCMEEHP
ncbi:unnamed protein product [Aureobasidium vineae]|uniref:Uncharacterized protein n=1 Tax=Aureobasidium vineae TaxID=2773715 RepID=A0A9N8P4W4_9PEZI|nr:unnamed protein product [Aureobasidium vineae]